MNDAIRYRAECACLTNSHNLVIQAYDSDELIINMQLNRQPFWQRIKLAVQYILGLERAAWDNNHYIEMCFDRQGIKDLIDKLQMAQALPAYSEITHTIT